MLIRLRLASAALLVGTPVGDEAAVTPWLGELPRLPSRNRLLDFPAQRFGAMIGEEFEAFVGGLSRSLAQLRTRLDDPSVWFNRPGAAGRAAKYTFLPVTDLP